MQSRVVQVGPLAASSTNNIALAQSPLAAGYLALNGTTRVSVSAANNICLSQSGTAATPLLLNGSLCRAQYVSPTVGVTGATVAYLPQVNEVLNKSLSNNAFSPNDGMPVYITSAGNDTSVTWTISGIIAKHYGGPFWVAATETVAGTNAGVSASANAYAIIFSVTPSANTASTVTVGTTGYCKLDTARRVLFTSSGTDTGVTITVTGTDWAGNAISETLTGGSSGSPVYTVNDYLTVQAVKVSAATAGTMAVGTNGVASSPWINNDLWASQALTGQCVVSGTVNYTVQVTMDDPNSYGNPVTLANIAWDSTVSGVNAATASTTFAAQPGAWTRILLNSNTNPGYVRMTIGQFGSVPY